MLGEFEQTLVIAPGNHDLNIVGYGMASLILVGDRYDWFGRWYRMQEYMNAAVALMGSRASVWCSVSMTMVPFNGKWAGILNSKENFNKKLRATENIFPIVVSVASFAEVDFLVWNTVRSSTSAFSNSFGEVGERQLANFKSIRKAMTETRFLHVMHHKLSLPSEPLLKNSQEKGVKWLREKVLAAFQLSGMVMADANKVISELRNQGDSVVMHGHHHATFWGEFRDVASNSSVVQIVSAPSTSLGVEYFTGSAHISSVTKRGRHKPALEILKISRTSSGTRLANKPTRSLI